MASKSTGTPQQRSSYPTPSRVGAVAAPNDVARSLVGEYLTEQKEEREAAARRNRPSKPWRLFASLAAIVACGVVWLVPLPSLGTPAGTGPSAARVEGSARLALFFASQRITDFQKRHGRLPTTARESGISDTRISYRLTSPSTFFLSLTDKGQRWTLPSTAADTSYLRDALARLARGSK